MLVFKVMSNWTEPIYSRRNVDKAGRALINQSSQTSLIDALAVINNWRSAHSYPLMTMRKTLQNRARKVDEFSISAQRLKRLSSIAIKLGRNKNMKLSQMQDIGGCRAVLKNINKVDELVDIYQEAFAKSPRSRSFQIEKYDYIESPKPDGYRSTHFVYKYRTSADHLRVFNDLRIEIQIRSQLQHAWATAVETVSTFTDQPLKTGRGKKAWRRFFALTGSAIAMQEGRPLVPNTPNDEVALVSELRDLYHKLNVETVLMGMSEAVRMINTEAVEFANNYLLVLNSKDKTLEITSFDEASVASEEYLKVEKRFSENPDVQAVLVSVDSLANLKTAYPNYYLDTSQFIHQLEFIIGEIV